MYFVIQVAKSTTTGPNYVYGPFTEEVARGEYTKRFEFYSSQYYVYMVMAVS